MNRLYRAGLFLALGCAASDPSGSGSADTSSSSGDDATESSGTGSGLDDVGPPDHYYVFLAGPFAGDLRGQAMVDDARTAADQLCATEHAVRWSDTLDCQSTNALVATEAGGAPASAPEDYSLEPTAAVLAAPTETSLGQVSEVFTGTLAVSLEGAGLFPDGDDDRRVWTGADANGNSGALSCLDWSTSEPSEQGLAGDGASTDDWWSGASASCMSEHMMLCLCH